MALSNKQKKLLFSNLVRSMTLDRMMMRIIMAGKMVGFYHEGGISLAPGVAAGSFLRKDDPMWIHYRAHGIAEMVSKGIDVRSYVAEHMGREAGCCKGRSSFHASFPDDHIFGSSGNIGANFPACTGYGFAARYKGTDQVVMNCSGDGSYHEGRAYEGMHMAATWKLPVIFWCQNNGMAQSSALTDVFPIEDISGVASGLGIRTLTVDGQDLFACGEAALKAIDHTRKGKGPIFVELKVLRSQEHNVGGLNNEGAEPRSQALMEEWKATRDPLKLVTTKILDEGLLTQEEIDKIGADAEVEAEEMELFCEQSPKATPSIEDLMAQVYSPNKKEGMNNDYDT
jgi:TPP-dependent pyruvate/acetoin dehydrogenase alpha subunit